MQNLGLINTLRRRKFSFCFLRKVSTSRLLLILVFFMVNTSFYIPYKKPKKCPTGINGPEMDRTDIFTLEAVDILSFLSLVILICCSSSFIFNFRFSFSDRASSSAWKNESKIEKSSWLSTVFGFSPKCLAVLCNVLSIFWRAFVSSASRGSADEQNADKVGTSRPSVNEA